jgi:ABC-type multidrug transport system fused ATPase/permease subunit
MAHRLSTTRNADAIFLFDEGRLAEHGTHDELVSLAGIYAGLVRGPGARAPGVLAGHP